MNPRIIKVLIASIMVSGASTYANTPPLFSGAILESYMSISRLHNNSFYKPTGVKITQLFAFISKSTKTRIRVEDEELSQLKVSIGCNNAKDSDILEVISNYSSSRWIYENKEYVLVQGKKELDIGFLARNEFQQKRFDAGLPVLDLLKNLNGDQRTAMEQKGVAFSSLPENIQQSIRGSLSAVEEQKAFEKLTPEIPGMIPVNYIEMLPRTIITFKFEKFKGFEEAFITVNGTGGERKNVSGFRVNNYKQNQKVIFGDTINNPDNTKIDRKKYRNYPELNQNITMGFQKTKLPMIMELLHDKYGINFVCDTIEAMPKSSEVSAFDGALMDYLDILAEKFDGAKWEFQKSGFVIFRNKNHPAIAELEK